VRLRREIAAQLLSLPLLLRREEQSSEHDVIFDDACVYYLLCGGARERDPGTLFLCFFEF
jgi:hypothetical protein